MGRLGLVSSVVEMDIHQVSRDARNLFFAHLPVDSFTEEEQKLVGLLEEVASVVQSFLPGGVGLQDWAEHRLPAEAAISANASGLAYVHPGASSVVAGKGPSEAAGKGAKKGAATFLGAAGKGPQHIGIAGKGAKKGAATFLGAAVASPFQHGAAKGMKRKHEDVPPGFLPAQVKNKCSAKLAVGLGGIETQEERAARLAEARALREVETENFFASLPEDELTDEEEVLRMAVFEFLQNWTGSEPAKFADLGQGKAIQQCKKALLPESVPFKEWIGRRLGEDIQIENASNSSCVWICLTGQFDLSQWSHI